MDRGRPVGIIALVLFALAAAAFSACGSRTNRLAGDGYEFRYPADWRPVSTGAFVGTTAAGALSKQAVGVDGENLAVMVTVRISPAVTTSNIGSVEQDTANEIRRVAEQGGGRVTAGPTRLTMGGLPALSFELSGIKVGKAVVDSRLVLAFQGTLEYLLSCQHTPDRADQVEGACDGIIRSFRVTGPRSS
jgi:hypothetical protein